jgi:hypothetical protein
MIHSFASVRVQRPVVRKIALLALGGSGALALAGCAGGSDRYPSFAIPQPGPESEQGRVAMRFPGVTVPQIVSANPAQETMPLELGTRLAAIEARAERASAAFAADLGPVQNLARAARGAGVESDSWADAQLRLAELGGHHDEGALALADLDLIAASAQAVAASADDIAAITRLQTTIAARLTEQARALSRIGAELDP